MNLCPKLATWPLLITLTTALWACADEPKPADINNSPNTTNNITGDCQVQALKAQPTKRFVQGHTFYLPLITQGPCHAVDWTITQAPAGQTNEVGFNPELGVDDKRARFVPIEPGSYTFKLKGTDIEQQLNVVASDAAQFINYNYYPTRSIVRVGGELWVANVYSPTISRLKADDLSELGTIITGPWPVALAWREGMAQAVVAQRADDTLGIIDVATNRLIDAVWVGDEPANVVLSPDGAIAYVTTATTGEVIAVDLVERKVVGRLKAVEDANAIAITPDGATLYVASYRSGHTQRFPYEDSDAAQQKDIAVIDAKTLTLKRHILDVGTTIRALEISPDGATLYIANTLNDAEVSLSAPESKSFIYEIVAMNTADDQIKARADISRQESAAAPAVHLYGMSLQGDTLWVVAESSDLLIALDKETLAERSRVLAPGRPRAITRDDDALYVHGAQARAVTRVPISTPNRTTKKTLSVTDPRDESIILGQRYFTGAGKDYASTWSCNSCHQDGLMDKVIWNAGPLPDRVVSRPFFWLEGTYPLGWAGYLSSVRNYAFTVNANVGVRPDTALVEQLTAYLSSLAPPPAANTYTERDGSLSEAATRGKAIFEGKAACAACHGGPLTTSRASMPEGVTEGITDIPAIVGSYRYGTWLKLGQTTTMREATVQMLKWLKNTTLNEQEIDDLTRYMQELTARDFFVLTPLPRDQAQAVGVDTEVTLIFNEPVFNQPENLGLVGLFDGEAEVEVERRVQGRRVILKPKQSLEPAKTYTTRIAQGFNAFSEREITGAMSFNFTTAKPKTLELEGQYEWVIDMPGFNPAGGGFDPANTTEVAVFLEATPTASGATLEMDYLQGLALKATANIDEDRLSSEPLPIPIGPSFADTTGMSNAQINDVDGDGTLDEATGTLTMSGPGFIIPDVTWTLRRPSQEQCPKGASGQAMFEVTVDDAGLATIDIGQEKALALYITDPMANIPMGPGMVTGGQTYLAYRAESFSKGFAGPVMMGTLPEGALDTTADNGGMPLGTPLTKGACYKAYVLLEGFKSGQLIFSVFE